MSRLDDHIGSDVAAEKAMCCLQFAFNNCNPCGVSYESRSSERSGIAC